MGLEILRHCPANLRRDLHAIFVPIGGGGAVRPYHNSAEVEEPLVLLSSRIDSLPDVKLVRSEPLGCRHGCWNCSSCEEH